MGGMVHDPMRDLIQDEPDLGEYRDTLLELVDERDRLRAELCEVREACGDYLKPYDTVAGAIKNLRQIALAARDLAKQYKADLDTLRAAHEPR